MFPETNNNIYNNNIYIEVSILSPIQMSSHSCCFVVLYVLTLR